MEHYGDEFYNEEDKKALYFQCVHELAELAGHYGLEGNLWHAFLAFLIANGENAFSTACEIKGAVRGSVNRLAMMDFQIFRQLFAFDFHVLDEAFGCSLADVITDYANVDENSKVFNKRIRDRICQLARHLAQAGDGEEFCGIVTEFYKECGVGKLGLHKAFRVVHDKEDQVQIAPITCTEHVQLSDLIGYELQKKEARGQYQGFRGRPGGQQCPAVRGQRHGKNLPASKPSSMNIMIEGLRMIEVYKHQFRDLSSVIAQVKDRNYKFIIYMDDLSFEEFEIEYKYLKAVIEGGLEKKPDNVLIYATSNRRHLIKESFDDTKDYNRELHSSDTVQEKLSLVARFGVTIYFGAPDKKEFQTIVRSLAARVGDGSMSDEETLLLAGQPLGTVPRRPFRPDGGAVYHLSERDSRPSSDERR